MADFNPLSCTIRATIYFAFQDPDAPRDEILPAKQIAIIQTLFSETMANLKFTVVQYLQASCGIRIEQGDIKAITRVNGQRFSLINTLAECQDGSSEVSLNFFVRLA